MTKGSGNRTPTQLLVREGLLTAALGVCGYVVLVLATFMVSSPGAVSPGALMRSLPTLVASWGVVTWVCLVAIVIAVRRSDTVRSRTRWILVAAIVAAVVNEAIEFAPAIAFNGPGIVMLFGLPVLVGLGQFVVAFGAGRLLAVQLLPRSVADPERAADVSTDSVDPTRRSVDRPTVQPPAESPGRALRIAGIVALALAWIAVLMLGQQWFAVTFRLFGGELMVSGEQATRYAITAVTAITGAVAAIVVSRMRSVRATAGVVALVVAVCAAFVFQVPPGRFWPQPAPAPAPYNDHPPCMGEGDPNCVGG